MEKFNNYDLKRKLKEKYQLSKRQVESLAHMMYVYNISEKAAKLEFDYRLDFKNRRNKKLEEIFGKRVW